MILYIVYQSAHSMVEQAKHAQANAEQKLKTANQTVRSLERNSMIQISLLIQIEALVLENTQLKKSVSELKEIINNCRSSSFANRSIPLSTGISATEQSQSSIRLIVRDKLHKRSSSDLQQSISAVDIAMKTDTNVVSIILFFSFSPFNISLIFFPSLIMNRMIVLW